MGRSEKLAWLFAAAAWGGCASHVTDSQSSSATTAGGGSTAVWSAGGAATASGGALGAGGAGTTNRSPDASIGGGEPEGGAPSQGGTGGTVTASGGASGEPILDAGATPPHRLRDTTPGDVVVFDPNAVYAIGYVSDVNYYEGPYGIAPLTDTADAVLALPLFGDYWIRPSDGHLLYSYLGSTPQGGQTTPLYEFRRDETDYTMPTVGETSLADVHAGCAAAPRGPTGDPNNDGGYIVAVDGPVYYGCYQDLGYNLGSRELWFSASGTPMSTGGLYPYSMGVNGRMLGATDGGTYGVFDLVAGAPVVPMHSVEQLFGGDASKTAALTTRAKKDGFWVVGGPFNDHPTDQQVWVDIDLAGNVVGTGSFAPLPAGVDVTYNNWTGSYPVLDGSGALYQYANLGSEGVIVRRPMTGSGDSTIAYRKSSFNGTRSHMVDPFLLITGGTPAYD